MAKKQNTPFPPKFQKKMNSEGFNDSFQPKKRSKEEIDKALKELEEKNRREHPEDYIDEEDQSK